MPGWLSVSGSIGTPDFLAACRAAASSATVASDRPVTRAPPRYAPGLPGQGTPVPICRTPDLPSQLAPLRSCSPGSSAFSSSRMPSLMLSFSADILALTAAPRPANRDADLNGHYRDTPR